MNYLFHLFLSGDDPELLVGNFMGDSVKGPLTGFEPPGIRRGLQLHRKIDSFAQRDPHFQASRVRLPAEYGLYRGVLVDLFYDHFLARDWTHWSDRSLDDFLRRARSIIDSRRQLLPPALAAFLPLLFDNLLPSYRTVGGIESALSRLSGRIRRPNPLAAGGRELTSHYAALHTDFEAFMGTVRQFSREQISSW